MFLRKMRWLCAAIVAAVAAVATPARSQADTVIQITELGTGETQTFTGTTASFSTTNYKNISVSVTPNTGAPANLSTNSLNTSVTAALAASFNPDSQLQVVVTSTPNFGDPNFPGAGFINLYPGEPGAIVNTAGNSSGIFGGTAGVSSTTQLLNIDGTSNNAASAPAISTVPSAPGDKNATVSNTTSLPDRFSIQQVISIRATADSQGSILPGSTIGATAGSTVLSNAAPVPAPAGLVLALTAVPVLGLRRVLRRKNA